MVVTRRIEEIRKILEPVRKKGKIIGFVPTMGALHEGHLSLVKKARRECDWVVVSIFVNPLQFGPQEDFQRYPRNFSKDEKMLKKEGVDLVFYPSSSLMYPPNFSTFVEETQLSKFLCGAFREGHFRGVCTVVTKLFNIVQPDIAYFGQKDYQQAQIIKRMVRDLNFPIKIRMLPIVRESSGLALSSRNRYLKGREKKDALVLSQCLKLARKLIKEGQNNPHRIVAVLKKHILKNTQTKIEYVKIVDPSTLEDVKTTIQGRVLIALALYIGKARLIDNALIKVKTKDYRKSAGLFFQRKVERDVS